MKIVDQATGKEMDVPPEGSLGLLALGDIGLKVWREARLRTGYEQALRQRLLEQKSQIEKRKEELKKKREQQPRQHLPQTGYGQADS